MKQILVELDEQTAKALERVAPSRERKRSAFVRHAIRRAIDAELERRTEAAYRVAPLGAASFDAADWEADRWPSSPPARPRRRSARK